MTADKRLEQVRQLGAPAPKDQVEQCFKESADVGIDEEIRRLCELLKSRAEEDGFEWVEEYDSFIEDAAHYSYLSTRFVHREASNYPVERRIEFVYRLRKEDGALASQARILANWIAPIPKKQLSKATKAGIATATGVFLFGLGYLIGRSF